MGDLEGGLKLYHSLLNSPLHQSNPLIPEIHELIGDVLAQTSYDDAMEHYKEAIVLDPKNPSPYTK